MASSKPAKSSRPGKRRLDTLSTRVLILNGAERLIAQKGVFGFTLEDVAAPLKVRVPSIYKHFASRDDVLVEVSRRFISALSLQFAMPDDMARQPRAALRGACDAFVDFHVANPAYVRLSLVDLATPQGGVEYVKRAARGPFQANFRSGPLAPMHRRLAQLLAAGRRAGVFRKVAALDFYRLLKSALLIRLVFPDDQLHRAGRSMVRVRRIKRELWDLAARYLAIGTGAP
jgi:AcrR family transcriptional regulator